MNTLLNFKKSIALAILFFLSLDLGAATWVEQKYIDIAGGHSKKELTLLNGSFPNGIKVNQLQNPTLLLRHSEGEIFQREFKDGEIPFDMPYKGSYHLFLQDKYVEDGTLYINLYKTRVYNKDADIQDAILKEIRGKTVGSHFGKEPFEKVPFEIILQKPIKKHHINCCLYSGDILPIKIYYNQQQKKDISLTVTTQKGWLNRIDPDKDGLISFEIPRNTYADISKNKRLKESMLLEASFSEDKNGSFEGKEYSKILYYSSIPLNFNTSPLEYSSQTAGFYVVIGVMLIFSLGLYYNRRKKKKAPKEIWFDEN